jgi:hypothetical protein
VTEVREVLRGWLVGAGDKVPQRVRTLVRHHPRLGWVQTRCMEPRPVQRRPSVVGERVCDRHQHVVLVLVVDLP